MSLVFLSLLDPSIDKQKETKLIFVDGCVSSSESFQASLGSLFWLYTFGQIMIIMFFFSFNKSLFIDNSKNNSSVGDDI